MTDTASITKPSPPAPRKALSDMENTINDAGDALHAAVELFTNCQPDEASRSSINYLIGQAQEANARTYSLWEAARGLGREAGSHELALATNGDDAVAAASLSQLVDHVAGMENDLRKARDTLYAAVSMIGDMGRPRPDKAFHSSLSRLVDEISDAHARTFASWRELRRLTDGARQ
jgi:hypothetical protein